MAGEERVVYVYDDFSCGEPVLLGSLYVNVLRGSESYSFAYDADWLKRHKLSVMLDPELQPFAGRQFPADKGIFGVFADASPDRWGRVLMNKRERLLAAKEGQLSLLVDDADNSISLDLAIRTAPRFNVAKQDAGRMVREMTAIIRDNWERLAKEYGLSHSQIEYMRPAFGECYRG